MPEEGVVPRLTTVAAALAGAAARRAVLAAAAVHQFAVVHLLHG